MTADLSPQSPPADAVKATPAFWNVPNTITLGRLALSVVVFALIGLEQYFAGLVVFALAALTDGLDGYLARRLGQSTPIGRQLDPLVDKVIVAGAYVYLLSVEGTGVKPWMVTAIITRELLIQGLRSHLEGQGQAFGAKMAGKVKTTLQCLSICAILAVLWLRPSATWVLLRDLLTWSAVAMTIYSGLGYVLAASPALRGRKG
ncbi:MAG: CDP-diacylglycerol--glycerol-3-phosphate 3-phosphatidyltransferase [Isosphaeraceae bacterium]